MSTHRPVTPDCPETLSPADARLLFPGRTSAALFAGDLRSEVDAPDFGDPVEIHDGEVPVFWACGMTPEAATMSSCPDFAIGHAPGHMAITDATDDDFLVP